MATFKLNNITNDIADTVSIISLDVKNWFLPYNLKKAYSDVGLYPIVIDD